MFSFWGFLFLASIILLYSKFAEIINQVKKKFCKKLFKKVLKNFIFKGNFNIENTFFVFLVWCILVITNFVFSCFSEPLKDLEKNLKQVK